MQKRIIIALESIKDYSETEILAVELAKGLQETGYKMMIYAKGISGNASSNKFNERRISMYDREHSDPREIPTECFVLIALDKWAIENTGHFDAKIKMKMSGKMRMDKAVGLVLANIRKAKK